MTYRSHDSATSHSTAEPLAHAAAAAAAPPHFAAAAALIVLLAITLAVLGAAWINRTAHEDRAGREDPPFMGTRPGEEPDVPTPPQPGVNGLPPLSLRDFEQRLHRSLGKPVVVNFWASWCGPCIKEAPSLAILERTLAPRGVTFIGINMKDDPQGARDFLRRFGLHYPNFSDPSGRIAAAGKVVAIPSTVVFGDTGEPIHRSVGAFNPGKLTAILTAELSAGSPVHPAQPNHTIQKGGVAELHAQPLTN